MLITTLSRAEVVRQFTGGAEATHLVTSGGHISHSSEGSGSEGKANGSSFTNVVGKSDSYYPSPFYLISIRPTNAGVAQLVEQEFCKLQVTGSIPVTSSMGFSRK